MIATFQLSSASTLPTNLTANLDFDQQPQPSVLTYSRFASCRDTIPESISETFDALANRCREPVVRDKKDGPAFCPATFTPAHRNAANAKDCSLLAFDLDNLPDDINAEDVLDCVEGIRAFTYSTHSHKLPDKGNRFRVVIAIDKPIPSSKYKAVAGAFAARFESLSGKVDTAGYSPCQMLYFPSCSSDRRHLFEFDQQDGELFDWVSSFDVPQSVKAVTIPLASMNHGSIVEGSRNRELFRIGCAMRGHGKDQEWITAALANENELRCNPPLEMTEILTIAQSVSRYPVGGATSVSNGASDWVLQNDDVLSEFSLAETVAHQYSGTFHYVSESGAWMLLDPVSKIWKRDYSDQITRWLP